MGGTGHHGGQDMEDTVLVFMDARSVKLLQKVNLKLMLGCTITHMESGHPGTQDMEDTVLLFMDVRSVKLLQSKSEADAWLYYNTYGVWPTWYTGYYTNGLALWGRKKREAEAISEAD